MNKNRDEILENAYRRGLPKEEQFEFLARAQGRHASRLEPGRHDSADAFYHYYSHFTRDQDYLEANLARLKTPVKVVWGEKDFYIKKEMGIEFAGKAKCAVQRSSEHRALPPSSSPEADHRGSSSRIRGRLSLSERLRRTAS